MFLCLQTIAGIEKIKMFFLHPKKVISAEGADNFCIQWKLGRSMLHTNFFQIAEKWSLF